MLSAFRWWRGGHYNDRGLSCLPDTVQCIRTTSFHRGMKQPNGKVRSLVADAGLRQRVRLQLRVVVRRHLALCCQNIQHHCAALGLPPLPSLDTTSRETKLPLADKGDYQIHAAEQPFLVLRRSAVRLARQAAMQGQTEHQQSP